MACVVPTAENASAGRASPAPSAVSSVSTTSIDRHVTRSGQEMGLSLEDLHHTLEKQRSRSQQESRGEAIRSAQTRILKVYARARYNRHGPTDSMSLPSFSRPQTGIGNESSRARSAVTLPSPPSAVLKAPVTQSKVCIRLQSALNEDLEPAISSLCRQCCEVLGPQACHQCARIQRRQRDTRKYEHIFPCLRQSDSDFSTAVVIKKCMPSMETTHIENLVAHGSILKPNFKETLERLKEDNTLKAAEVITRHASQRAMTKGRGSYTFFSSIRDLNHKIVSGSVSKKTAWGNKPNKDNSGKTKAEKNMTFTELICPMFISPKRLNDSRPAFLAMYEPPLLPKACQNVEPAFFAGSEVAYKLPDRLPEKLVDSD